MSPLRSEWPHDEVGDAKRRFLAASVPLNPLLIVKHHPLSSVGAAAAVGVALGAVSHVSMIRMLTTGWVSRGMALAIDLAQKYGMAAMQSTRTPSETDAVG